MRITMIGSGYVGLVSGACFADFGQKIICFDNDDDKIVSLKIAQDCDAPTRSEMVEQAGRRYCAIGR